MANPNYVYAGAATWPGAAADTRTHGLYRLDPHTNDWEELAGGLPAAAEVRCILLDSRSPGIVWVGTQDGPFKSGDAGETWTALPLPAGRSTVVWSLVADPRNPDVLFAGAEDLAIYRSDDGGERWRLLPVPSPRGLCAMGFPSRVVRLAIDPAAPDHIYAGIEVGGVIHSLDGGESWSDGNTELLALAEQDQLKSRIGSDTETEGMMDSHALALSAAQPGAVFLANRMGLFRSDDQTASWTNMQIGRFSELTYARDIKVAPHEPATLLAALSGAASSDAGSLYRSPDLGQTWTRFDHGVAIGSTLMIIAPSGTSPDRVYCAARRGEVLATDDGGGTWQEHPLPTDVQGVYALAAT
jgi:photosystem II stability/assembly factor-like uncharacterized protein